MNQQNPSRSAMNRRAITLFVVAFLASAIIWPLSVSMTFENVGYKWVLPLGFVIAACSQVMLFFRYCAAPSLTRFYSNLAFWIYLISGITLWIGGVFLAGMAATDAMTFRSLSLFIPRLLLAFLLLVSTIALERGEKNQGIGNRAYAGWIWIGSVLIILFTFIFSFFIPIPQTFSIGVVHRVWELIPLTLFATCLFLVIRKKVWLTHHFAYGMAWTYLLETVASLYLLFASATGTMFGVAGFVAHLLALAMPILFMQMKMFGLYSSSEQHRLKKGMPQLGSRGIKQKLEADVFRQSVEQSQEAFYIANVDGEVIFVNEEFLKMTGYNFKDVHSKTPDFWTHKMEEQEDYASILSRIRIRKEAFSGNRWHRRKDGTPYEAMVHISPVVDEFGEIVWFIGREHDLTESRERTLFLQQVMDNMPIGICLVEAPSTNVVLSNQYAETLLLRAGLKGMTEFKEACGSFNISEDKTYPTEKIPLMETLQTKEEAHKDDIEIVCSSGDGEESITTMIWKMHTMPLFDAQGELKHVLIALDDVTHQKQLEHKMSDAISVASHQLRTPLTGIKWAVEELQRGEEFGASREDKIAIFGTLHDATIRMFNVVQGLLDVSKLEQGNIEMKPEPFSLQSLISEVVEELHPQISAKKLNIKQSTLHSIPDAEFDVLLVRQVVQNLLDNSVKYTSENGEIDSILSIENGKIQWALHDTGIGIPKEEIEHLFEKFHRGDNAQKVDAYGMGLGLYTAKFILDILNSEIRCDSEEGKGTTFRVLFPIKK